MARVINPEEFATEVLQSSIPVVVDVFAPWCGPCRMVAPVVDAVSAKAQGVCKFVKLNRDDAPQLAQQYGASSIPTFLFFKEGRLVGRSVGYKDQAQLQQEMNRFFAL